MTAEVTAPAAEQVKDDRGAVGRLLLASFLMLFLELALIRWLGANIVHLSYFSNFVLLGSFLGIGLGFLISRKTWSIWWVSLPLLTALAAGVLIFPVTIERSGSDLIYFTSLAVRGPPAWLALPVVFVLVALILAGPAEIVGHCFGQLRPLSAYRYDLIGSLIGIATFTTLSFLRAPSVAWGVIACVLYLLLARSTKRVLPTVAWSCALLVMLTIETMTPGVSWSPYYKVTTLEISPDADGHLRISDKPGNGFLQINVNGVPHQVMAPADWKLRYEFADVRNSVPAIAQQRAGRCPDRRSRVRLGRVDRAARGCGPGRCSRHRSADPPDRRPTQHRPALCRQARDDPHQRRPGLSARYRPQVRPHPFRPAELAHAGQRSIADPAGVHFFSPGRR